MIADTVAEKVGRSLDQALLVVSACGTGAPTHWF